MYENIYENIYEYIKTYQDTSKYIQGVSEKRQHNDFNYFCFTIPLYGNKSTNSNTYMTKFTQLAIIQAFIAL